MSGKWLNGMLATLAAGLLGAACCLPSFGSGGRNSSPEQTVFLYSYFHEPNGWDGLQLAWSTDFFTWAPIEGPHFKPTVGYDRETQRGVHRVMRDCYLDRGPDGVFHLVWTSNWSGNHDIGYARSEDLITWTGEKLLPVMADYPHVENCWAPKLFYDEIERQWLVFWSSTLGLEPDGTERFPRTDVPGTSRNHRIWYVTTRDFETLSEAKVLFDPGHSCIDAMMMRDGETYRLFFKDGRANNAPVDPPQPEYQNIRMASASSPYGPWGDITAPITSGAPGVWQNEGPTAIRHEDWMYVFFDHHARPQYWGSVRSRDLQEWEVVTEMFSFPPRTKHGHIFRVPLSALEPVLEKAGKVAGTEAIAR